MQYALCVQYSIHTTLEHPVKMLVIKATSNGGVGLEGDLIVPSKSEAQQ